jgi:hypothetical protein
MIGVSRVSKATSSTSVISFSSFLKAFEMTQKNPATKSINPAFTAQPKNLTTPQAAELLNVSIAWLERQRWLGTGPCYSRIGRNIRYSESVLWDYVSAHLVVTSTSI